MNFDLAFHKESSCNLRVASGKQKSFSFIPIAFQALTAHSFTMYLTYVRPLYKEKYTAKSQKYVTNWVAFRLYLLVFQELVGLCTFWTISLENHAEHIPG